MFKRKYLILFAVLIIFTGIVLYFVLQKKNTTQNIAVPLPQPSIPSFAFGTIPITLNVKEQDVTLPQSVPVLEIKNPTPITNSEAFQIAKNLGISGNPITANDIKEGLTYIWNGNNSNLTIYSLSRRLNYLVWGQPTSNTKLDQQSIISAAKNFLVQKGIFSSSDINFSFLTYLYGNPNQNEEFTVLPDASTANLYQVNFSPSIAKYKVLTLKPKDSPIKVFVTLNGTVTAFDVTKNQISEGGIYSLKSFKDIQQSLGDAKVVSLDNGNSVLQNLSADEIKGVSVNNIELAYLQDSFTASIYQPVFLLEGTATITGSSKPVNAILYLPAIAK